MAYAEIIAIYCKNYTEYMNTVRGSTEVSVLKYHYTSV